MRREKHYATVVKRQDFLKGSKARGAVHISSDTLTGGAEWPEAFQPRFPCKGLFWVPDVEEQLEVDLADPEHPDPRISGFVYSSDDDIHDLFAENYPFRRGWVSLSEHHLIFDDDPLQPALLLFHNGGTGFEWNSDGDELKTVIGSLLEEVGGDVERTVQGDVDETVEGDVRQTWNADLIVELGGDARWNYSGSWRFQTGDLATTDIGGDWSVSTKGDYTLVSLTGGVDFQDAVGATLKLREGKVALGAGPTEVLKTISDSLDKINTFLQTFATNAPTWVSTSVGPGVLSPAVVTDAATLIGELTALKTALDAITGSI